jgi:predicted  nucleic acid-binding Zn-ribbon protein
MAMNSMRNLLLVTVTGVTLLMAGWANAAEKTEGKVIYRYKNKDGVTVLNSQVPPEYVNKGYEIMSRTGKVLSVVQPAVQGEEGERLYRARLEREAQEREDVQLRRSYSNVADIDAAKKRNLESLRGNIGILQTNLTSARSRLQSYRSQAAALERSGRALPDDLLKNIGNLEKEESDIQLQIQQREEEFEAVTTKFDQDRERFIEISQ